jgi:hypothetical protein
VTHIKLIAVNYGTGYENLRIALSIPNLPLSGSA